MTARSLVAGVAITALVLVSLIAVFVASEDPSEPRAPAATKGPRSIPPAPPRPIPEDLEQLHSRIAELQRAGDFRQAAPLYLTLLRHLAGRWGGDSPDLAPYYYNFAYCLKLAGRRAESSGIVLEARARWPRFLQLQVLDAIGRAEACLEVGRFDPELDRLFRDLLTEDTLPRIRGLGVDPAILFAQHAELLLRDGRAEDAEQVVARGLEESPGHRLLRRIRGRVALGLARAEEARKILAELAREETDAELEHLLGLALLEEGKAQEAAERLEPLVAGLAEMKAGDDKAASYAARVRLDTARALREAGRPRAAIEALLGSLARLAYDSRALQQIADAARALGRGDAADAIARRVRELQGRESRLRLASAARAAGRLSSAEYYDARAAMAVDRTHEAIEALTQAVGISPGIAQIRLELARVYELIGRSDRAVRIHTEALDESGSALFVLELARLAALRGDVDSARRWLVDPRGAIPSEEAQEGLDSASIEELAFLLARRVRVYLMMGEVDAAREFFARNEVRARDPEELLLCRAELALVERRYREAGEILGQSFDELPGGRPWQQALSALVGACESGDWPPDVVAEGFDPSAFLDHPRLLDAAIYLRSGVAERVRSDLQRWLELRARADEILARLRGFQDADVVGRWSELLELWIGAGAARKAREVAWFLRGLEPNRVDSHRRLAHALGRPEELVEKWAVVHEGLAAFPEDGELVEAQSDIRRRLGLDPGEEPPR